MSNFLKRREQLIKGTGKILGDEMEKPIKFIVAMLRPEAGIYKAIPYVISSNHPRFSVGTRFDYGFLQMSLREGYTVTFIGNEIGE